MLGHGLASTEQAPSVMAWSHHPGEGPHVDRLILNSDPPASRCRACAGSALGAEGVPANPDVQASLLAALALAARAADAPPLPPGVAICINAGNPSMAPISMACWLPWCWLPTLSTRLRGHLVRSQIAQHALPRCVWGLCWRARRGHLGGLCAHPPGAGTGGQAWRLAPAWAC